MTDMKSSVYEKSTAESQLKLIIDLIYDALWPSLHTLYTQ